MNAISIVVLLLAQISAAFGGEMYPEPRARYGAPGNKPDCLIKAEAGMCMTELRFMLLHCPFECSEILKNENINCQKWADEGECHNNPKYMNFRCAEACGRAIVWNPWTRRTAELHTFHAVQTDDMPLYARCESNSSMLYPAFLMHDRVRKFLAGTQVNGFTYDSPSELNGLIGVVEAIAYSMRIYGAFIRRHGTIKEIGLHSLLLDSCMNRDVLTRYSADAVMRSLPDWGDQLDEALDIVENIVKEAREVLWKQGCAPGSTSTLRTHISTIADEYSNALESCLAAPGGDCNAKDIDPIETIKVLRNGVKMPLLGLGTWKLSGGDCENIVAHAIKVGYRHFDSAEAYHNEWDVGFAIRKAMDSGFVRRDELFIATKLSNPSNAGTAGVRSLVMKQMGHLQVDYLDLYMLHSPLADNIQAETWAELEKMYDEGIIRALGVSNFGINDLLKLFKYARIKPMVLQNKFDVYHQGTQFDNQGLNYVKFCAEHDMLLVSYSPFSAYPFTMVPLEDPIVQFVADRNGLTAAETLLLWHLQQGLAVIPRSSRGPGLRENLLQRLSIVDSDKTVLQRMLSRDDMALLSAIEQLMATPVTLPSR